MTRRTWKPPVWPTVQEAPEREADRAELEDLLELLGPERVPCRTLDPAAWTSEDFHERKVAARACAPCPALARCREFGLAWPEEHGVYGGFDRGERTRAAEELQEERTA